MAITGATSTTPQTQATTTTAGSDALSKAEGEYNTFLKLLTAQIRNQDPLAPLDSTQFVEQLATFSSLEQQVTTNTHLSSIAGMITGFQNSQAAEWVGQQAEVKTSWVPYVGGAVDFTADFPSGTDKAEMILYDADGNRLGSSDLDLDKSRWTWDGTLDGTTKVANGYYQMVLEVSRDGAVIGSMEPYQIVKVIDASVEDGEIMLGFANGMTEPASSVRRHAG